MGLYLQKFACIPFSEGLKSEPRWRGCYGTVAQLGERRTEDAEAAGSSPASPTTIPTAYVANLPEGGFTVHLASARMLAWSA